MEVTSFHQTLNRHQSPIKPAVSYFSVYTAPNTHTYRRRRRRATHRLTPDHNGDSSLSGSEDQSCWIHSPSAGNPINLQEELCHCAILSSHLNIYSLSLSDYLRLTLSDFLFQLWPALSHLNPFICPTPIFILFVISYLLWSDSLSSPFFRRFF